jgi:cold shock CspA family protein
MTGTIKNFLPQKQFGFILGDDGKDYFFHQSSLVSSGQTSQIMEGA